MTENEKHGISRDDGSVTQKIIYYFSFARFPFAPFVPFDAYAKASAAACEKYFYEIMKRIRSYIGGTKGAKDE